jgi:hypothetical protein
MEMVKLLLVCAAIPMVASAEGFSLTIGPPVAAVSPNPLMKTSKGAAFAVRLEECDALDKAQISGTAEGLVNGARTSAAVTLLAAGTPGVYVVSQTWSNRPNQGVWVVNLNAKCGSATAGAIVPMGPAGGFQREGIKLLPRVATKAEIETALKALPAGSR